MKVAVPLIGEGVAGDPFRPKHVLHGQMHLDLPTGWVVFTDTSFEPAELVLEGVRVLEGESLPPPTENATPPFLLAGEEAPVEEIPGESWTKEELLTYARKNDIAVDPDWRKSKILGAIRGSR